MARIDNSNPDAQEWYEYEFNDANPGDTPPVDLCRDCYETLWSDLAEIDHPPYEDEQDFPYTCFECREVLTATDN